MTTKVTRKLLDPENLVVSASIPTTSGNAINVNDLAGAKRITINFMGVDLSATSSLGIQIGTTGGNETSGYLGAASTATTATSTANSTGQFMVQRASGTRIHGAAVLTLVDEATNTWAFTFMGGDDGAARVMFSGGSKSLAGPLDRLRVKSWNGTDTFTAGKINVVVEY